jgi:hypothetical protein
MCDITPNRAKAPNRKANMAERYSLEDYETVDMRLRRLYTQFPQARILTDMVYRDERSFIVKAELYINMEDLSPVSTGYAEEIVGVGFVNKTSALENCETSAIGRCISNSILVLGTPEGKRPSMQEMEKVERYKETPRKPLKLSKPNREYTQEETDKAVLLYQDAVNLAGTVEGRLEINALRVIWTTNTEYLDVPVNGTTLKDLINKRVKELSA